MSVVSVGRASTGLAFSFTSGFLNFELFKILFGWEGTGERGVEISAPATKAFESLNG